MDDDNIFDEDEALDYIMSEEVENQENKPGCLGLMVTIIFIATPTSMYFLL